MLKIHKFIVGVSPSTRMFRIPAVGGLATDAVLELRGKANLSNDYYTQVTTSQDGGTFQLRNPESGNYLTINRDNITFIKDSFELDFEIDTSKAIREFLVIWKAITPIINIRDIKRLGIAAEHLLDINKPNNTFIDVLTKFNSPAHPAKFHLKYEERIPTKESLAPDIEKDDFLNVISDFYDSEMDVDHPKKGSANVNLDVQRYFFPRLTKLSDSDVEKHFKIFEQQRQGFFNRLSKMSLVTGE
jgi:hypothetical protein